MESQEFRVRYVIYRIHSVTKESGTQKLATMLKNDPESFFILEDASVFNDRRPLWRRLLGG